MDTAWTSAQGFISTHARLAPLKDMITSSSFTADGYVGLGVPLGTDAFVQKFVYDKCLQVIGDVVKLDPIANGTSPLLSGNPPTIPELPRFP